MDLMQFKHFLLEEEAHAFSGWDFSHLKGRWRGEDLLWDYETLVRRRMAPHSRLLDIGTGGGEFLLELGHPHALTSATEGWPPNLALCRQRLMPLGIDVRESSDEGGPLPFADGSFDLVIDRHAAYDPAEVTRVLAPGGWFVTQQVGGRNDEELSRALAPDFSSPYPLATLAVARAALAAAGLAVEQAAESFTPLRFYDVGAVVFFAKAIPWEFPGFSVQRAFGVLCALQRQLERAGYIQCTEHRYLLVAQKPVRRS